MGDNISESSSNGRELPIQMQQEFPRMDDNRSRNYPSTEELSINIPQDLPTLTWDECCIFKLPRRLREMKPEAYTPQVVSIGPIHHGDQKLKGMHKWKLRYLVEFCERINKDYSEIRKQIQDMEERVRRSYLDTFDELGKDEFVEIILLDSVFVIELLWKMPNRYSCDVLRIPWLRNGIIRDLMLLENQLPFFVLQHMYDLSYGSCANTPSFYSLVLSSFQCYIDPPSNKTWKRLRNRCDWFSCFYCFLVSRCFSKKTPSNEDIQPVNEDTTGLQHDEHKHFTDVIRKSFCRNLPKEKPSGLRINLCNVKALYEAGVKFQADPATWTSGVKFENGVLKMPRLYFDDDTECLLRNITAYEQCHNLPSNYFSSYIVLLDDLINTEDDVQLLVQSGVVTNLLGDNKNVKDLVNGLGKHIWISGYYSKLYSDLNEHCENSWYPKAAILRRVYFGNIWKGTGTIAAFILLVFSFIQTLNSMMEIFK